MVLFGAFYICVMQMGGGGLEEDRLGIVRVVAQQRPVELPLNAEEEEDEEVSPHPYTLNSGTSQTLSEETV